MLKVLRERFVKTQIQCYENWRFLINIKILSSPEIKWNREIYFSKIIIIFWIYVVIKQKKSTGIFWNKSLIERNYYVGLEDYLVFACDFHFPLIVWIGVWRSSPKFFKCIGHVNWNLWQLLHVLSYSSKLCAWKWLYDRIRQKFCLGYSN